DRSDSCGGWARRCRPRGPGAGLPPESGARGVAGVLRLRPAMTAVEREVNTGTADARGEWTGPGIAGVTGLLVDVVVGPGHQDVRVVGVHGQRRLVLLVLREGRFRARHVHKLVR